MQLNLIHNFQPCHKIWITQLFYFVLLTISPVTRSHAPRLKNTISQFRRYTCITRVLPFRIGNLCLVPFFFFFRRSRNAAAVVKHAIGKRTVYCRDDDTMILFDEEKQKGGGWGVKSSKRFSPYKTDTTHPGGPASTGRSDAISPVGVSRQKTTETVLRVVFAENLLPSFRLPTSSAAYLPIPSSSSARPSVVYTACVVR